MTGKSQVTVQSDRLSDVDPFPEERSDTGDQSISATQFLETFGEDISHTLDVREWPVGNDLHQEYSRIEREVREAVDREDVLQARIREHVFPRVEKRENAPKNAGRHEAKLESIEAIHRGLLFNGGVEACHGAIQVHDTLPLTIYQIGVSLVSYKGDQGTWCQRLFRKDLRQSGGDPIEEAIDILERRAERSGRSGRDSFGELVQKAVLDYAERAVLLHRSDALWRMGHGSPITYELMTGGANLDLMVAATSVMRELVEQKQKFLFVGREPRERMLLTIGQALRPMEFVIIMTLEEQVEEWFHQERFVMNPAKKLQWDADTVSAAEWVRRFRERVASQVIVGLYRATKLAPAQLFYAHVDHADFAANIAIADSVLQEHRGFPMLADMAHDMCESVFSNSLEGLAETAHAAAGVPWRYFSRRSRRNR